jgi:DNA ligase-1
MILGRAFPKWSQKNLDLSWTTLNTVLRHIAQVDWSVFTEAFSSTGDIGSATKALFENTRVQKQTVLIQKQLSIKDIRETLDTIAATTGSGSKQRKERLTEALFSQATPAEAKYLVKILTGEMRTGFHEGLMEQAVAKAFDIPLASVQNASMALGDVGSSRLSQNRWKTSLGHSWLQGLQTGKTHAGTISQQRWRSPEDAWR